VSDEREQLSLPQVHCEPIWDSTTAASYLQIHPRTLIKMARSGEIPAFQIGTHWRFRRSDLDEWMGSKVSSNSKLNGPVRVN
jgi:excisionase family DNA binding protein